MKSKRFQIRLSTLLLLTAVGAVLSLLLVRCIENAPVRWEPYSASSLKTALDQKRVVLVLLRADWDTYSWYLENHIVNHQTVKKRIRSRRIKTLIVDCTASFPKDVGLWTKGHSSAIGIFHNGNMGQPIVLPHNATLGETIDVLDRISANTE